MAKPAFIYAFDNLGPYRFAELCGELLGARYEGFLLGGVGADGGIDGEIDNLFGELRLTSADFLEGENVEPDELTIFQFKHEVSARLGQAATRRKLLKLYECSQKGKSKCEIHSKLVISKTPNRYVLITNVEINSQFRQTFIEQCQRENPNIKHYQVIGLDELELWITSKPEIRHLYLPTIFGPPAYNLKIEVCLGLPKVHSNPEYRHMNFYTTDLFSVSLMNIGSLPSYVGLINVRVSHNGVIKSIPLGIGRGYNGQLHNPEIGTSIEPGRRLVFYLYFAYQDQLQRLENATAFEFEVVDEIGNVYRVAITDQRIKDKLVQSNLQL